MTGCEIGDRSEEKYVGNLSKPSLFSMTCHIGVNCRQQPKRFVIDAIKKKHLIFTLCTLSVCYHNQMYSGTDSFDTGHQVMTSASNEA